MEPLIHRSALKHGVSPASIAWVIDHAGLIFVQPADPKRGRPRDQFVFLGDDADGRPLEVMSIEGTTETVLVIHAMALRSKFSEQYVEAMMWRRA